MSLQERLEERIVSFVVGIAVATLGLYLVLIQLLGLAVVRREDYMLRSDVVANYIRKDAMNCREEEPSKSRVHGSSNKKLVTEATTSSEPGLQTQQTAPAPADPIPSAAPPPRQASLRCLDPEVTGDFQLQACECKHDNGNFIQCVWFIKNINHRDPIKLWAEDAHVTDNQSRDNFSFNSNWSSDGSGFGFCQNGSAASLMYNDWTRFCLRFRDSNPDLKTLNARIDFRFDANFNHLPYEFREIPVR